MWFTNARDLVVKFRTDRATRERIRCPSGYDPSCESVPQLWRKILEQTLAASILCSCCAPHRTALGQIECGQKLVRKRIPMLFSGILFCTHRATVLARPGSGP